MYCVVHHRLHYVSRTIQNMKISCMDEWIVDTMKEKFTKMVTLVSSFCLEAAGQRQWRLRKRDWKTYYWHIRSLANIMEIGNIYIHSTYQILKFQNKKAGVQKIWFEICWTLSTLKIFVKRVNVLALKYVWNINAYSQGNGKFSRNIWCIRCMNTHISRARGDVIIFWLGILLSILEMIFQTESNKQIAGFLQISTNICQSLGGE